MGPRRYAFASLLLLLPAIALGADLRVGIFASTGAKGMKEALAAEQGLVLTELKTLDADSLFKQDILLIGGQRNGFPDAAWAPAVELFVRCGGGVMLNHDATGYRGWDESLFPKHFRGVAQTRDNLVAVTLKTHPLAAGLPEQFRHAYYDHIVLDSREAGTVVLSDGEGKPLVVAGELGRGRVLGCGMVVGFAERVAGKGQGELAPVGGEKQFLVNAVRWLGERPLTQVPAKELAARRVAAQRELPARENVVGATAAGAGWFGPGWFTSSMLNEQGYVHPPIEMLPGRFFLFEGPFISPTNRMNTGREYGEIVAIMQQLKWMGVTDFVCHTGGTTRPRYPTRIPDLPTSGLSDRYGFDYLDTLLRAARETGLNVWAFWHPKDDEEVVKRIADKSRWIRNDRGDVYGAYIDIKSPATLALAKKVIDELADRYGKHGSLKGIFLDELWHPFASDLMEGREADFAAFCRDRFGEAPPPELNLREKFSLGGKWHDPADKWWRRYVIYRNTFTPKYMREVTAYAESKGFKTMAQVGFNFPWHHGQGDTYSLARATSYCWSYEHRNTSRYECYPSDRVITGTHANSPGGYNMGCMVRGNYGSCFTFQMSWQPLGYGHDPLAMDVLARQIRTNREWYGAQPVSRCALVTNRLGLDLAVKDAVKYHSDNDAAIQLNLSRAWRVPMLIAQDAEYFERYPVLIIPKYGLSFVSETVRRKFEAYLQQGGQALLLDADISTAHEDLTEVKDWTQTMTGVRRIEGADARATGGAVVLALGGQTKAFMLPDAPSAAVEITGAGVVTLAKAREGGSPLVTQVAVGKGRIVSVHFDLARLLTDPKTADAALDLARALIESMSEPPVRVKGDVLIYNAVRKGNWVVVSFLPPDSKFDTTLGQKVPARATLYVDMKALGIDRARYKVVSLARDREMFPQGANWDYWGQKYWTADILRKDGIDVYIAPNSLKDIKILAQPEDPYDEYTRKYVVGRWSQYNTRCYEHEIIAIAPVDEASMIAPEKR